MKKANYHQEINFIAMTDGKSRFTSLSIVFLMFCVGMYLVPLRMMHTDLSFIPGDLGDSRLNNYVLEHGYRWMTGKEASFWNAPFFYPTSRTLSFSVNHLGTLPIYALFRSFSFDRETSYQLWFLALFTLNYFSCAWALRRLSLNAVAVAAGAFVFTFSLPVIARMGHSQLLPRFMIPIAFYYAWSYLDKRHIRSLALTCLAIVIQFYCDIYMGYFLVLGLVCLAVSYVWLHEDRLALLRDFLWGSGRIALARASIVFAFVICLLPLAFPYYLTSLEYGVRSWHDIVQMLMRARSYLNPASGSVLWNWLSPLGSTLPMAHEHQIFVGALPLAAFIALPIMYFRFSSAPLIKNGMIACITIALLVFLTMHTGRFPSPYGLALYLPGLKAIRAVTRIILMMLFPFSLALAVVIHKLTAPSKRRPRFALMFIFSAVILGAVVLDQSVLASGLFAYPKHDAQNRSQAVERLVKEKDPSARVLAYMPKNPVDPQIVVHIDAMMAAQHLGMLTVNGYSGNLPHGYFETLYGGCNRCDSLHQWKAISLLRHNSSSMPENALFDGLLIVGQDGCEDDGHTYSFMNSALPDDGYRAAILFPASDISAVAGRPFTMTLRVKNISPVTWSSLTSSGGKFVISLSYRWLASDRTPMGAFDSRERLPYDVAPGGLVTLTPTATAPGIPGTYYLEFDLVQELVTWFREKGGTTSLIKVVVS